MHHPRCLITGARRGLSRSWLHRYDDGSEITYKIINASSTAHKEELWQFSGLYVLLNILNTFCTFFFYPLSLLLVNPISLCVPATASCSSLGSATGGPGRQALQ